MFFKRTVLGALFLATLALLAEANHVPCPRSEQLKKCTCLRKDSASKSSQVDVKCTDATTDDIEKDFSELEDNRDIYHELELGDVDLQNFHILPKHMHPEILKFVNVKNLPLETLKDIVNSVSRMKILTVDGLGITKVSRDLFGDKHILEILSLNDNGIEEISDDTFEHFHSLGSLSLENNKLTKIPKAIFKIPPKRLILRLNGNPITQVDEETLKDIKANEIQLLLNSVDCSCKYKNSPFMKWAQETKSETISCGTPEKFKETDVHIFMDGKHCSGAGGPVLLSSFLLLLALYLSHLLKQ